MVCTYNLHYTTDCNLENLHTYAVVSHIEQCRITYRVLTFCINKREHAFDSLIISQVYMY